MHEILLSVLQLSSIALPYNSLTGTLPNSWGGLTQVSTPLLHFAICLEQSLDYDKVPISASWFVV